METILTLSGSARRARSRGWNNHARSGRRLAEALPELRLRVICDRFPGLVPDPGVPVDVERGRPKRASSRRDRSV